MSSKQRPSDPRSGQPGGERSFNPPSANSPRGPSGGEPRGRPETDTRVYWLVGAALLLAALFSVGYFGDGAPQPPPSPAVQSGASLLLPVAENDTARAINHLLMTGADKESARAGVSNGKLRLAWITLSDNFDEDGDWVRLEAAGFRQDVRLLHNPYQVAVPYLPGSPITVTGLIDGSGGNITVTVNVGAARVSLKPLTQGETLYIPAP